MNYGEVASFGGLFFSSSGSQICHPALVAINGRIDLQERPGLILCVAQFEV